MLLAVNKRTGHGDCARPLRVASWRLACWPELAAGQSMSVREGINEYVASEREREGYTTMTITVQVGRCESERAQIGGGRAFIFQA